MKARRSLLKHRTKDPDQNSEKMGRRNKKAESETPKDLE